MPWPPMTMTYDETITDKIGQAAPSRVGRAWYRFAAWTNLSLHRIWTKLARTVLLNGSLKRDRRDKFMGITYLGVLHIF